MENNTKKTDDQVLQAVENELRKLRHVDELSSLTREVREHSIAGLDQLFGQLGADLAGTSSSLPWEARFLRANVHVHAAIRILRDVMKEVGEDPDRSNNQPLYQLTSAASLSYWLQAMEWFRDCDRRLKERQSR